MTKPSLITLGLALCVPAAFAETPEPEVITHLNGLDVEVKPMGVPISSDKLDSALVGIRAIKVMNNTDSSVTCEFHVPDEARADTSAPPVFTVSSRTQRVERVPGEYSPDQPFAELTCRDALQSVGEPTLVPSDEADVEPAATKPESPAAAPADPSRSRESNNRSR